MKYFRLILLLFVYHSVHAQQTYFEPVGDTLTRFFFDENYYLVDQHCEFKTIERVTGFNKDNNKFEGKFKDFDVATGHAILHGSYRQGLKEGVFKAFYPDGKLRWETTFQNDAPLGEWRYYYPDGKLHLIITLTENSFTIDQMWNEKGDQVIVDGNGLYNLDRPIIGFTEHGYTYYNRTGEVKDGVPEGRWPITMFVSDKVKEIAGTEIFKDGKLAGETKNFHLFQTFFGSMQSLIEFPILPSDYFPRAEYLIGKGCTFDDFSGFTYFIGTKFQRYLKINAKDLDLETEIQYQVNVSRKGAPRVRNITSSYPLNNKQKMLIRQMVNSIYYYLPSYLNDKPINDKLTVHFTLKWNEEQKSVTNVQLQREKGQ